MPLHQIYVDECQDHTQAEIKLFILLCSDPNALFLAGDTAQAISRGIAFRFADIRGLFYQQQALLDSLAAPSSSSFSSSSAASSSSSRTAGRSQLQLRIGVPSLHHLATNYRSHSGILDLAASVVEVLQARFPLSIDRLERDRGLYPGPKPRLILNRDICGLALAMTGGATVEFGAEQVIIVRSEEAKQRLPPALRAALVLTVAESKGLEFDDALLWDFFSDSPAQEEWRTLSDLQNAAANVDASTSVSAAGAAALTDADNPQQSSPFTAVASTALPTLRSTRQRCRPLAFAPLQHKALEGELKALYVAVTRARKRLFIFDRGGSSGPECDWPRTSAFEFLERQALVDVMCETETADFARASTPAQWRRKGRLFLQSSLFELAAQCFDKGAAPAEAAQCRGLQFAQTARDRQAAASAADDYVSDVVSPGVTRYAGLAAQHFLIAASAATSPRLCSSCLERAVVCLRLGGLGALAARLSDSASSSAAAAYAAGTTEVGDWERVLSLAR